jgi:hypothetical protein
MEDVIMRFKVHVANDLAVLDEDNSLVCIARTPQEAALMAAAPDMRGSILELLDVAQGNHSKCDWLSDVKCRAEEYGGGNAGEHLILRNAEDAIGNARDGCGPMAAKPEVVTVVIATEGGIPDVAAKPDFVTVNLIDFDTEGECLEDLCDCDMGSVPHGHTVEPATVTATGEEGA